MEWQNSCSLRAIRKFGSIPVLKIKKLKTTQWSSKAKKNSFGNLFKSQEFRLFTEKYNSML